MATSTSGDLPKLGRPKLGFQLKRMGLQAHVYDEWMVKKRVLGFDQASNTDFAKYLLNGVGEKPTLGQTSYKTEKT